MKGMGAPCGMTPGTMGHGPFHASRSGRGRARSDDHRHPAQRGEGRDEEGHPGGRGEGGAHPAWQRLAPQEAVPGPDLCTAGVGIK